MLLLAAFAMVAMPDWVPARWFSKDPVTLKLVESTPVNCLLMEKADWSPDFSRAAAERGIATLGVVRGNANAADIAAEAKKAGLTGLAVEGSLSAGKVDMPVVELVNRAEMKFGSDAQVLATKQGMWPGIRAEQDGLIAAPTGAPWIDTNTGFLRYARVSTPAAIWIGERVPAKAHPLVTAYLAAIGDAGMTGARWVLDFDEEFARGLAKGDPAALKNWALIVQHVKFYEDHKEWRTFAMRSTLALVEAPESGALISGGVLDMMATKHTPVTPIPARTLDGKSLVHSKMAVNVDPELLSANQKEALKTFTRAGGTLLTGPPGWRFPSLEPDQITLDKKDLETLDSIWKELNTVTGRENLGARLFNVGSMLSNLLESPDGKQVALELVNYSDYPVQDITVHVLGKFKKATLMRPEAAPQKLDVYEVEEGTGIDVPALGALGTLILEP
ncbi:MAG TPA: hypothetical protein VK752_02830 [Bryobacteraceae bacterium]|jgi:hypothetical protein|nr:hypothetical protein [Bryobacteraceae bacterium]